MASTTEMYFSQFWRLESSKSRCQWSKFNSEASSLDLQIVPYCWVLTRSLFVCVCVCGERENSSQFSDVSSLKDTNPIALVLHRYDFVCAVCWVALVVSDSVPPYGLIACQAPLSMGFSRQEHWSGLPCPPPGDLPDPGIEPASFTSPALAGRYTTTSATWEAPYDFI